MKCEVRLATEEGMVGRDSVEPRIALCPARLDGKASNCSDAALSAWKAQSANERGTATPNGFASGRRAVVTG